MLKCGQTGNKKYTFGLRKEQREEAEELKKTVAETFHCASCGLSTPSKANFCPHCGAKI